jgi:hypothetical protein
MRQAPCIAQLHLNDKPVGEITVRRWEGAWGFGEFVRSDGFAEFAPLYGRWSLLMHADDDAERLSPDAADELRAVEQAQYRVHAKIFLPATKEWRDILIINIDGSSIEWKEATRHCVCGTCNNHCDRAHEKRQKQRAEGAHSVTNGQAKEQP